MTAQKPPKIFFPSQASLISFSFYFIPLLSPPPHIYHLFLFLLFLFSSSLSSHCRHLLLFIYFLSSSSFVLLWFFSFCSSVLDFGISLLFFSPSPWSFLSSFCSAVVNAPLIFVSFDCFFPSEKNKI